MFLTRNQTQSVVLGRWLVGKDPDTKIWIWIHRTYGKASAAYIYNPSRWTERWEEETTNHRPTSPEYVAANKRLSVSKSVEANDQPRLSSDLETQIMGGAYVHKYRHHIHIQNVKLIKITWYWGHSSQREYVLFQISQCENHLRVLRMTFIPFNKIIMG